MPVNEHRRGMTYGMEGVARGERPTEPVDHVPSASLLISSRNRPHLLWETIQSILAGDQVPDELIVVDQSDAPDVRLSAFATKRACALRYLWRDERGVSLGRNAAAAAATHPILVLTDDDMLVTPTWFGSLLGASLAAGPRTIVTGRVLASREDSAEKASAPSTRSDEQAVVYEGRVSRDVLFTNNMAIHRSAFNSVGGFDTRLGPGTSYPAAEDNDLAFRLLEAGYRIVYDPRPTLYHRAWRSERELFQLYWNYGYGQGAFYAKHVSLRDRFVMRRMMGDVWAYLSRFPLRLWRQRDQAYRDGLFVTGLLWGALQWRIWSSRNQHDRD